MAGTHLTATPKSSSSGDALLIPRGSCCRKMRPGFRRGGGERLAVNAGKIGQRDALRALEK
jgi:hypothetical protein